MSRKHAAVAVLVEVILELRSAITDEWQWKASDQRQFLAALDAVAYVLREGR